MLDNKEYISLIKKYTDLYRGKFINDAGVWVQLVQVDIYPERGDDIRHSDAIIDRVGNLWRIDTDIEEAMASGKIKDLANIPKGSEIVML